MGAAHPDVSFTKPEDGSVEAMMLWREQVANVRKHWVRATTACNSRCLFCLDMDTPRNVYLPEDEIRAEILRGRTEHDAWKLILSGGEGSLHPAFPELIRYAREVGYGRVQTVSNGWRFADRDFYEACVQAGLGEITFSLHGHTAELHNRLTQHPGAFERITRAIHRTARDPRVVCSVDVVINQQNVAVLDKVVQLGIQLGVTEFDLLHVIPQSAGFWNRDQLFYDPKEHLPVLQRVFRLNRHPRFVVWTNRFPIPFLEGMEDLIQDPHKMIDEVEAFRFDVRRYLDEGTAPSCRQPERCVHCYNEPFCTTMDEVIAAQRKATVEVWEVGPAPAEVPEPVPFGVQRVGVERATAELVEVAAALPAGLGLHARLTDAGPLPPTLVDTVLVVRTAEQAEAWLDALPAWVSEVELWLGQATAPWLLQHTAVLDALGSRLRLHQPTWETLEEARRHDLRDVSGFFRALGRRVRVSGLPACLAVGVELVEAPVSLPAWIFDPATGRPDHARLARHHVVSGYRARSSRCSACPVAERCAGLHVQAIRHVGLGVLQPVRGAWAEDAAAQLVARWPEPPPRVGQGRALEAVAPSLPGHEQPAGLKLGRKRPRGASRLTALDLG